MRKNHQRRFWCRLFITPRNRCRLEACTTMLCLVLCALGVAAPKTMPSSAEACIESLLKAMDWGDAAAVGALVNGDESQRAWIAAHAAQMGATRKLRAALDQRFAKEMKSEDGEAIVDRVKQAADDELQADLA